MLPPPTPRPTTLDRRRRPALIARMRGQPSSASATTGEHDAVGDDAGPDAGWARRAARVLPGGASTGSKRVAALYGADEPAGPTHFRSASGCRVVTADGQE